MLQSSNRSIWPVELLIIPLTAWVLAFLFPNQLGLLTQIATTALFILALDVVTGYAGIVTLGHAAFFGLGAYAAGIYATRIVAEPLSGLVVGGAIGATVALLTGAIVLRARGLSLIMMTIAVAQIVLEIANKARVLTGGDDGLSGIEMAPIFGMFEFDFTGRTGLVYSVVVLTLSMFVLRRIMRSAFGLTCVGIREDRLRMSAMGCNIKRHLLAAYGLGGLFAGIAGALSAQTVQVVGLHSLSFTTSAEALVMLILGGTGRLWGALIGALLFMTIHHIAAELDPFRWMLTIGGILIAVVLVAPGGVVNSVIALRQRLRAKEVGHV